MNIGQWVVFGVLLTSLVLFITGRWRYDLVALLALLAVTLTGTLPATEAFLGFSHPAVVTVAAVLVVSRGLLNSGIVDLIARWMGRIGDSPMLQIAALTSLVAILSGFMNNVGALALLMPVAIRLAKKNGTSPSLLLMPLAFGSLLGGLVTLIGTPPNIIIATFRAQTGAEPFRMFDFAPVGTGVAVAGILFIALGGWRLIPQRKGQASAEDLFQVEDYLTEVRIPVDSSMEGKMLSDLEESTEGDVTVVGMVRGNRRRPAPSTLEALRAGDILIVEADSEALKELVDTTSLELVGSELDKEALKSDEVTVLEAVITTDSIMVGRTARTLHMRARHGVNLLAVSRQGTALKDRLGQLRFKAGDVLLLQGEINAVQEALGTLGCLPLAERGLRIGQPRRVALAIGLFGLALGSAATGVIPVQIAFVTCAVAMVMTRFLTLREAYTSIDWPVIVLLGAMIPVGVALEKTGGADLIAHALLMATGQMAPLVTLTVLLIGTMFLSDLVNNAAAAVLMAPIAISVAQGLGVSADPLLMGVAIGSSAAFLTPIGHQSNTLVMGPGGYKFGDYWRLGLPLEVVIAAVAIPLIMWVWPF